MIRLDAALFSKSEFLCQEKFQDNVRFLLCYPIYQPLRSGRI